MVSRFFQMFQAMTLAGVSALTCAAGSDVKVESSAAVRSPDGKRTAVVDRLSPVVDGRAERNSGKMMVRVTGQGQTSQRFVEASQVRVIHPPVWDEKGNYVAYTYNVAKNSNGVVYFDPAANRALQVEFVASTRFMGASKKMEQELTSLEVTDHSSPTIHIRTIPFEGKSVFPLAIELPTYEGRPFGASFYQMLLKSADAYRQFLAKHKLENLEPEEASESFSSDKKFLAALACAGAKPHLLVAPITGDSASVLTQAKVWPLEGVLLSCVPINEGGDTDPVADSHFSTTWADGNTVLVQMETFGAEDDTSTKTDIYRYSVKEGKLEKLADPAAVIKAQATPAPDGASEDTP